MVSSRILRFMHKASEESKELSALQEWSCMETKDRQIAAESRSANQPVNFAESWL